MSDLFDSKGKISWYHYVLHLGYYIPHFIRCFFKKPFAETKRDLNILETVATLLDSSATSENIEKSKELTRLHRIVENTKARRRLEKWSLKIISSYLLIVLMVVLLCYIQIPPLKGVIQIPESIMIAILTTTTVNIIGLGLIVLRGHFLANDKSNDIKPSSSIMDFSKSQKEDSLSKPNM